MAPRNTASRVCMLCSIFERAGRQHAVLPLPPAQGRAPAHPSARNRAGQRVGGQKQHQPARAVDARFPQHSRPGHMPATAGRSARRSTASTAGARSSRPPASSTSARGRGDHELRADRPGHEPTSVLARPPTPTMPPASTSCSSPPIVPREHAGHRSPLERREHDADEHEIEDHAAADRVAREHHLQQRPRPPRSAATAVGFTRAGSRTSCGPLGWTQHDEHDVEMAEVDRRTNRDHLVEPRPFSLLDLLDDADQESLRIDAVLTRRQHAFAGCTSARFETYSSAQRRIRLRRQRRRRRPRSSRARRRPPRSGRRATARAPHAARPARSRGRRRRATRSPPCPAARRRSTRDRS